MKFLKKIIDFFKIDEEFREEYKREMESRRRGGWVFPYNPEPPPKVMLNIPKKDTECHCTCCKKHKNYKKNKLEKIKK